MKWIHTSEYHPFICKYTTTIIHTPHHSSLSTITYKFPISFVKNPPQAGISIFYIFSMIHRMNTSFQILTPLFFTHTILILPFKNYWTQYYFYSLSAYSNPSFCCIYLYHTTLFLTLPPFKKSLSTPTTTNVQHNKLQPIHTHTKMNHLYNTTSTSGIFMWHFT